VSQAGDVERLFTAAAERGPLAALVCAAGVLTPVPFAETTQDIWDQTIAVNLTGSFLCCRAAFCAMRPAREGRIVTIASLSGVYATEKFPGLAAYNVSKYGVIGLTEAIAVEGRPDGISAICVSPGAVDTQMLRRANPDLRPGLTPADVAALCRAAGQPAGAGERSQHPALFQCLTRPGGRPGGSCTPFRQRPQVDVLVREHASWRPGLDGHQARRRRHLSVLIHLRVSTPVEPGCGPHHAVDEVEPEELPL